MRVTLISGEYPPMRGGVADYTAILARELAALDLEVAVLTSIGAAVAPAITGVAVEPVVQDWGAGFWATAARHVARFQPDVWHVQYQTGAFGMKLGINLLPWLYRPRPGRPKSVVTFHDLKEPYVLPKLGRLRHLATAALAAGSDAVVVTNAEDFARIAAPCGRTTRRAWGGRRLAPIPIGSNVPAPAGDFDRVAWRARLGIGAADVAIAYFGFLGPDKGIEILADAFARLLRRRAAVRLVMIGASGGDSATVHPAYGDTIRQILGQPGIGERVTWTGFLAPAEVAAALRSCDLGCLPFRDGVSLRHGTLMAALSQGLPLVTTKRPGMARPTPFPSLESERDALLVPAGDPLALAEALQRLIADPELRGRLAAGASRLAETFGWETIARQTAALYREL